jgi:hypothetical protein
MIFTDFSLDFLLVIRFVKLFQIIHKLEIRLSLRERFRWFSIIKLVLELLYLVHYCASAMIFIGL